MITSAKSEWSGSVNDFFSKVVRTCLVYQVKEKSCLCRDCIYVYDAIQEKEDDLSEFVKYKKKLDKDRALLGKGDSATERWRHQREKQNVAERAKLGGAAKRPLVTEVGSEPVVVTVNKPSQENATTAPSPDKSGPPSSSSSYEEEEGDDGEDFAGITDACEYVAARCFGCMTCFSFSVDGAP
jgi:hypothetical protein